MNGLHAALSRSCLLVACCWAMLQDQEAAAENVHGIDGPRGRHLRSNVLAPSALLQRSVAELKEGISMEKPRKQRVMDFINKFRAETCARMKDEHGKKFESYDACKDFMRGACKPGKDNKMDGDRKEVTSGEGYCEEYFHAEKKAEEEVDKEDKEAEEKKKAEENPGEKLMGALDDAVEEVVDEGSKDGGKKKKEGAEKAAADKAAADKAAAEKAAAEKAAAEKAAAEKAAADKAAADKAAAGAPAPASSNGGGGGAGSPAAAGAPGAAGAAGGAGAKGGAGAAGGAGGAGAPGAAAGATAGAPGGAPAGAPGGAPGGPSYPADEAWYHRAGAPGGAPGTDFAARIGHMDAERGLPTQGFEGALHAHQDMETSVGDWQAEYTDNWDEVCAKHPDSPWCTSRHHHSGSIASATWAGLPLLLSIAVLGVF